MVRVTHSINKQYSIFTLKKCNICGKKARINIAIKKDGEVLGNPDLCNHPLCLEFTIEMTKAPNKAYKKYTIGGGDPYWAPSELGQIMRRHNARLEAMK